MLYARLHHARLYYTRLALFGSLINLRQNGSPLFLLPLLSLHLLFEIELLFLLLYYSIQYALPGNFTQELVLLHYQLVVAAIVLVLGLFAQRN